MLSQQYEMHELSILHIYAAAAGGRGRGREAEGMLNVLHMLPQVPFLPPLPGVLRIPGGPHVLSYTAGGAHSGTSHIQPCTACCWLLQLV
jgi:hypothetical protein